MFNISPGDTNPRVSLALFRNREFDRGKPAAIEILWILAQVFVRSFVPGSVPRVRLLRLFGARLGKGVVIKPGFRVKFPWRLRVGNHCWLGEDSWIDNLAEVTLEDNVCISQGAYLCTGNHDWSDPSFRLIVKPITIKEGAWVGARAVVCPGVTVGESAVVTAGSVVTKDVPPYEIHAGNPAGFVRPRRIGSQLRAVAP